ncbi:ATP-binding protein [Plastoroseomonas arctica]|uniref:histidine kinase n=1 Tax=Plastoroseomonas arctica TaxID=1509237 RepID=A0AAF1JYQ6_9PROT|nr:ATP-binding protein [Plastoroseomonas arctica]MBR0657139.1 HAMP domain-containing protein [Plastoroseomonas arctica]
MRLPRSLALRVTLLVAAIVLLASALGFGMAYFGAVRLLQHQLDDDIREQAATLTDEFRLFGVEGLRAAIEARALHAGPEGFSMRLSEPGREASFAGRSFEAPEDLRGATDLVQPGGRALRAHGVALPDGVVLVVVADLQDLRAAARGLAGLLAASGVVTAAIIVVAGLVLARGLEGRLARISAAAGAVMDGDLAQRLPLAGRGDELDRLAQTINHMLSRIEALMATLRQVTNDVAHDLRGPLSRLRQRLEGALAEPRAAAADQAVLEAALEELDGVLATFAALLRIAQVEAGTRRAAFAALDLSALVAAVVEVYAPVAEEAGASLTARVVPGVRMQGDAALLRQMLANLIENALAHGGAGVRIGVSLMAGPVLEVRDDGPGVPAAERARVMGRFYRMDRSRATPGAGLGLALVAAVAGLHECAVVLGDAEPGLRVRVAPREH